MTDLKYKDSLLKQLVERVSVNRFGIMEPSLNSIFIRKAGEALGDLP